MPAFSAFRRSDDASSYSTPARRHSDISAIDFDIPSPLPAGQSRAPGPDLSGFDSVRATPRSAGRQMWPYEQESSESDLGFFHPQPSRLDETRMTSDEVFDYADIHGFVFLKNERKKTTDRVHHNKVDWSFIHAASTTTATERLLTVWVHLGHEGNYEKTSADQSMADDEGNHPEVSFTGSANEEFVAPHELWDPVRQRIRGTPMPRSARQRFFASPDSNVSTPESYRYRPGSGLLERIPSSSLRPRSPNRGRRMDLVTLDRRDGSFLGHYLPEDASPQYGDELVDEDGESDGLEAMEPLLYDTV
ncbi:unnamed protein product [Gongylonema pulchrum]|uniref:Uncharacterized protein n=1 Tax=Gongylonema pulchrum TaxID=637853 RepID=A0A183DNA6_9BILA|nr:unnamed protein product [Gongylonema pulchrum]